MEDRRPRGPEMVYLCYEYPVLTQTFTRAEIEGLAAAGLRVTVVSCRRPGGVSVTPEGVHYLAPPFSRVSRRALLRWAVRCPARVLSLLGAQAAAAYRDEPLRCWARGFLQFLWGVQLAERYRDVSPAPHFHAQFVDAASTVGFVASRLLGAGYSFTNHTAYNPYLLGPKVRAADVVFSISEYDRVRTLREARSGLRRPVVVAYQGIDPDRFGYRTPRPIGSPVRILSVAALREKKGHDVLLSAAALLAGRGLEARVAIVGEGPDRSRLERRIGRLEMGDRATLVGAVPHEGIRDLLHQADLFVLACRRAANGDIDGIPISLMEAMAAGVPVVSTRISGIPELIGDGVEGLLAPPGDPRALADRIEEVVRDPARTAERVRRARARIEARHDLRRTVPVTAAELMRVIRPGREEPTSRGGSDRSGAEPADSRGHGPGAAGT